MPIMKSKRNEGRFNGLQDSIPVTLSGELATSPSSQSRKMEESKNLNSNAPPRSKWTDVDHSNSSMNPPQEQEMQRRDPAHLMASQPQHNPILHPSPSHIKSQAASINGSHVTNGLPDPEDRKQFTPFNVKTSASLANAANVNLQQSSMANGLLQNQQQRNQPALDNTWSGQLQMSEQEQSQSTGGTGDFMPPRQQQEQNQPPQQSFDIIGSHEPGKPPQFVLRNPNQTSARQQIYTGFPAQFSPEQQCMTGMHASMMQPEVMMQPPEMMMQHGGMIQPGAGMMQPGAGMMQPGAGMMQPGAGMMQPNAGMVQQGGVIPPGAIMKDGSKVPPGTILQPGAMSQLGGMQSGMMMQPSQVMPQTMPPNMASEIMPHGQAIQPSTTYPYAYSSPNANYSYQTSYQPYH